MELQMENIDAEEIRASREHRNFTGFSMGAAAI